MPTYPKHILRCQHIKVNGTQCGSPALTTQRFCFFHQENRPRRVRIGRKATQAAAAVMLPVLEDANSIQVAVMQITRLLLGGQIDHKTAGLTLYALQIASSNLARITFEADRPTRIVIDRARVAETPLGRTPWSASGVGHDSECDEEEEKRHHGGLARLLMRNLGLTDEEIDEQKRQLEAEENGEEEEEDKNDEAEPTAEDSPGGHDIQACVGPAMVGASPGFFRSNRGPARRYLS